MGAFFIVCKLYVNNINQKENSKAGYIYAYVNIISSLDMKGLTDVYTERST